MEKIKINPDNLIKAFNGFRENAAGVDRLISELCQAILKYGFDNPLSPEFVNTLLEKCISPARGGCRDMTQLALECLGDVNDIKKQMEELSNIDHELDA